jgi:hypothetical protein
MLAAESGAAPAGWFRGFTPVWRGAIRQRMSGFRLPGRGQVFRPETAFSRRLFGGLVFRPDPASSRRRNSGSGLKA